MNSPPSCCQSSVRLYAGSPNTSGKRRRGRVLGPGSRRFLGLVVVGVLILVCWPHRKDLMEQLFPYLIGAAVFSVLLAIWTVWKT